ncbi:MAG: type I DNA topoisomerase [Gammaproteobacteria bacterium]|nr:type I DNA topoisomerase [Gammaproteobacteria bacterium]
MTKNLVIVESPAKCKTIKKYLGNDFQILASYGHVRDLPAKQGAVLPDENFAMTYTLIDRNSKHVDAIVKAMKECDALYLATDPDREGEAISWHLYEILKAKKLLKDKPVYRVAFYEITKNAVTAAIQNPRELSMDLVNAQQARRALDYLVGFNLSPLLWKKVRRGLSAGRVQSPALRMIVERELEIEAFTNQEYWTIEADLFKSKIGFMAKLTTWNNASIKQFDINNTDQANSIKDTLMEATKGSLTVSNIDRKQRKRNPSPPFTTSTLQQEGSRKLGFSTKKTMQIAQQLYEGVDVGEGSVGLITYMRTDSLNLSNDAIAELREFIGKKYGAEALPEEPRFFKTKSKNAQEAHEAIRPSSVLRTPESLKEHLNPDQFKLYSLIWKRATACQMQYALIDTTGVDFDCAAGATFRATGSVIVKPGFMQVYQEGFDDKKAEEEDDEKTLPALEVGDKVDLLDIRPEQHFTEPPPRYSEASLVKALEEHGIGRPSTYSSIISTLQAREYVILETKRFKPTDVGRVVNKFLTEYFERYVDYGFTASLEDQLDEVSRGELQWIPLLEQFWQPFKAKVDDIGVNVQRSDITQEKIDEVCPDCGKPLSIRLGKRGRFIGCTGYPECSYTRAHTNAGEAPAEPTAVEIVDGRTCPDCEGPLHIKQGKYGKFIGCGNYPKCKHMEPLVKPKDLGICCPECKQGDLMERKSRYGKLFYSCSRYPECKYATWNLPIQEPCPQCNWPILTIKTTKRNGTQKVCPQKECGFAVDAPELAPPAAEDE